MCKNKKRDLQFTNVGTTVQMLVTFTSQSCHEFFEWSAKNIGSTIPTKENGTKKHLFGQVMFLFVSKKSNVCLFERRPFYNLNSSACIEDSTSNSKPAKIQPQTLSNQPPIP